MEILSYSRFKRRGIKITFLSIIDPTASRDQAVSHPDPERTCPAVCSPPWVPIGVAEPDTSVTVLVVDSDEESDTEDEECERCVRDYTMYHVIILHSLSSYSIASSAEDCYM